MDKIKINTKSKNYNVYIEDSFIMLKNILGEIDFENIFIITDDNVEQLYLNELKNNLANFKTIQYVLKSGEQSKNLDIIKQLYEFALKNDVNKSTLVVALGGGVVGDVTAFFSSTYYRGIKYIQIPTTLLSQVDSSVGGKTGVDFLGFKNIIGSIYQPQLVFINIRTLSTLQNRDFNTGMAEIIKYAAGFNCELFNYLQSNSANIKKLEKNCLMHIIKKSIEIKNEVVTRDELDGKIRMKLNLGHTFGHSIEKCTNFSFTHGEAIAIGTMMSLNLSEKLGLIQKNTISIIEKTYKDFNLPTKLCGVESESIYENMLFDKKKIGSELNICIVDSLGNCKITSEFTKDEIISAIKKQIGE